MSVWIRNLQSSLGDHQVLILHGNVRDKYIDQHGHVYENLTDLLIRIVADLPLSFSASSCYDVREERLLLPGIPSMKPPAPEGLPDQVEDQPDAEQDVVPPPTVLVDWLDALRTTDRNCLAVLYYLDKLVAYNESYSDAEKGILLLLEKLIENITPNHRLVLVALRDTMVPVELYTYSPKTRVVPIPMPDKADREAYLRNQLKDGHPHLGLAVGLTDGLFLRDLDHVASAIQTGGKLSEREVRRLVNKYRIGEQEDHWGALKVEKLRSAQRWFVDEKGVKGQPEAVRRVQDMLVRARAGMSASTRGAAAKPRGVLFFAGPTGVGKTFLAKKLAEFLFGTEEAFLRFDMSEFKEEHTVSKLIGSPPGYVGSERGGMLTNAVRERPFSVVLFDEIEKAHPKILDIFLQLLDDGRLTDSRGQTVFFTETVIIFTSNLGTREYDSRNERISERRRVNRIRRDTSLSPEEKTRRTRKHFLKAVRRYFMSEISRPELLNRIGDNIIPFDFIDAPEVQKDIVQSQFRQLQQEFADRWHGFGFRLALDEATVSWLVDHYRQDIARFGARCIVNAVKKEIETPLAYPALEAEDRGAQGLTFRVALDATGERIEIVEE